MGTEIMKIQTTLHLVFSYQDIFLNAVTEQNLTKVTNELIILIQNVIACTLT